MGRQFGRYELKAKIAQGGMAEVFLAVQRGPGGFEKLVAIKQLLPELAEEPGFVEMFLDEARIAASLAHPNICQIFELGCEAGRYFIAMEYLSGASLSRLWKRSSRDGEPLPPSLAALAVLRAAEGLAHAHERAAPDGRRLEIVHRDVSPQNIVVTYDGHVKVVDFGIAKATLRLSKTRTGVVKGKISYMSPEQVRNEPLDGRSDVFALGVVLHELLASRPLFRAESDVDTVGLVLEGAIPSVRRVPNVTPALALAVERATERDPARRPTAREFAQLLDAAVHELRPAPNAETLAAHMKKVFATERAEEGMKLKTAVARDIEDFLFGTPPSHEELTSREARPEPRHPDAATVRLRRPKSPALFAAAAAVLTFSAGGYALWYGAPAAEPQAAAVEAAPVEPTPTVSTPLPEPAPAEPEAEPAAPAPAPRVTRKPRPSKPKGVEAAAAAPTTPTTPPAAVGSGKLTLDTVPWTEVFLGAQKLGTTPLVKVELPAGSHHLRLVNAEAKIDQQLDVTISSGQTLTLPRTRL